MARDVHKVSPTKCFPLSDSITNRKMAKPEVARTQLPDFQQDEKRREKKETNEQKQAFCHDKQCSVCKTTMDMLVTHAL